MIKSRPLVFRKLLRSQKPIDVAMIWPRRLDNQSAHAWLRDVISRATDGIHSA
jgi:hypothetical protein